MRTSTRHLAMTLPVAAALLLSGCSTGAPKSAPSTSASSTSQAPVITSPPSDAAPGSATNTAPDDGHGTVTATGAPGPLEAQLLGDGDVPSFSVTSKGDVEQAAGQAQSAAQATAGMSVQPAPCDPLLKSLIARTASIYGALGTGSVQGFSSSTGQILTEAIVGPAHAAGLAVDTTGIEGCADAVATMGAAQAKVAIEAISLSIGDSSRGAFVTQALNVGGGTVTTVTGNISIEKNGSIVALTLTGPSEDPAAMKALFIEAAKKAYAKAEPAL